MVGNSLTILIEPVYRHRAPGTEERMGSAEETLQNCTKSIPKVFFPAFANEYAAIYLRNSTCGKQTHSGFSVVTQHWL